MKNPLTPWLQMFEDAASGVYDLPAVVLTAKSAADRLDAALADLERPDVEEARARAVAALRRAAAKTDEPLPETSGVRKTATALADADARRELLTLARDQQVSETAALIGEHADEIIVDFLRPVHDRALATFREAADLLPETPSMDLLLRAPARTRSSWLRLDQAATHYGRVTSVAGRLHDLTPPQHDVDAEFAMARNIKEVWPLRQIGRTPPWRFDDTRLSMLWLVRHGADLWLPTAAERDAAWWSAYGENVERMRAARHAAGGFVSALS